METKSTAHVCATCGRSHEGLPTDVGFQLPDAIWALPDVEREAKAKWTSDLCQMGDDYFIRSFLAIPLPGGDEFFGWGVWVKVSQAAFMRYLELYQENAQQEPGVVGELANRLDTYDLPSTVPVILRFGPASERPSVDFPPDADHALARDKVAGMSDARYHDIVAAIGPQVTSPA